MPDARSVQRLRARAAAKLPALTALVGVMLLLQSIGPEIAAAVGPAPPVYLMTAVLASFYFARSGAPADPFSALKAVAGFHFVAILLAMPLWTGWTAAEPGRLALLLTPILAHFGAHLLLLARQGGSGDLLERALGAIAPERMCPLLAAELRLIGIALFHWRRRRLGFTSAGVLAPVLLAVAALSLVEVSIVHLLLAQWSVRAAWVATGLGLFTAVYMLGLAKALHFLPNELKAEALLVRLGHFQAFEIPYDQICAVRLQHSAAPPEGAMNLALMSTPNVLILLSWPYTVTNPAGRERTFERWRCGSTSRRRSSKFCPPESHLTQRCCRSPPPPGGAAGAVAAPA